MTTEEKLVREEEAKRCIDWIKLSIRVLQKTEEQELIEIVNPILDGLIKAINSGKTVEESIEQLNSLLKENDTRRN